MLAQPVNRLQHRNPTLREAGVLQYLHRLPGCCGMSWLEATQM